MDLQWSRILEVSFTLIILYLVLSNADHFATAVGQLGQTYVSGVKALQGR